MVTIHTRLEGDGEEKGRREEVRKAGREKNAHTYIHTFAVFLISTELK